jgi:hypothetical protein
VSFKYGTRRKIKRKKQKAKNKIESKKMLAGGAYPGELNYRTDLNKNPLTIQHD